MRSIYLVRHGIPAFPNGKTVIQGANTDLPLNVLCYPDASNLKEFFLDKQIDNWYASPLLRARQTMEQFIPCGAKIITLEKAREVCFGEWEGYSWEENKAKYPILFEMRSSDNTVLPPGGEDMRKAAKRMLCAVNQTESNCVIATHWTVISLLYCLLTGYDYKKYTEVPHPYLGVTKINFENAKYEVEYVGRKVCPTPFCDTIHNY